MKTILRVVLLVVGFLGGIAFSRQFPNVALNIDNVRQQEQAKIQPQIEEAAAKAKLEILNRVFGGSSDSAAGPKIPGASFVGGGGGGGDAISMPADKKAELMGEMDKAKKELKDAETKMGKAK